MLRAHRAASASIASRLAGAATPEEAAEIVVDVLRRVYTCEPSVFTLHDSGWTRLSAGTVSEQVVRWHSPLADDARTPATEVRRTRQPILVPDLTTWDADAQPNAAPVRDTSAAALYPLLADDDVIGTLVVVVQPPHVIDGAAHRFLKSAAEACAVALQRLVRGESVSDLQEVDSTPMSGGLGPQQQMLFDLVEHAPFGIYVVGSDFRIVSMNRRAQDGAFRFVRPVIGRDFAETMRIVWPEVAADDIIERFRTTLASGEPYASKGFSSQRADSGATEAYEWELQRVSLPNGQWGVACYYYDSTPLRSVERALRRSQDQLTLLRDAVPALIFYLDERQRYESVNHTFERWFGVPGEEIVGRTVRDFDGESAWSTIWPQLAKAYRGELVTFEADVAYRFGGVRSVHVVYTPHCAADGHVLGVVGHVTDISARRRIETALVRSEASERERATLLQTVLDTSPIPIWMTLDTTCEHIVGNAAGDLLLQPQLTASYSAETHDGIHASHPWSAIGQWLHDGQVIAEDMLPMQRAAREGATVAPSDFELIRYDGSRQRLLIQAMPLMIGGECAGAVAVAVDITERTRAEEQMRSDLRAMSLMQELGNACTRPGNDRDACLAQALDAAVAITNTSRGLCQLLDPTTGTLRLAALREFDATFAAQYDDRTASDEVAACSVALRERRRVLIPDLAVSPLLPASPILRRLSAAGVRAVQCTPLVASHGRVLGVISTHATEPGGPDERALQLLDLLARQIADYLERIESDDALKQADRRKDEFLATLSHELRNPLVPLKTGVQLLRAAHANPHQLTRITEMMERQVGHMVRLVDDLLEVSRITRGSIDLHVEPLDLRTVVSDSVDTVSASIEAAGHRLDISIPSGPVRVQADRVRMTQVIVNVLNNAVKYTTRGGMVSIAVAEEAGEAVVRVRDTGVGIPEQLMPRIFDLFSQVDRSVGRTQGGLGIGLSLARHLVSMHHGRIEARSAGVGRGSEFIIALPIVDEATTTPSQSGDTRTFPVVPQSRRVLVVDDNHDAADALAMLLQAMGAEVCTAYDGPDALKEARRWRPSVIFLDLGMPGMDGFAVANEIRRDRTLRDVALVALTGWGQQSVRQRTDAAGFDAHLVKPVDADTLAAVLDAASARASGPQESTEEPLDDDQAASA
ncbi:MAG: PAS domain-containing protein [Vicinamibacterales bacterium]